jgi:methionyl-tRNA formyltransferase
MPAAPGTMLGVGEDGALAVATGEGILEVLRIQPEGRPERDGAAFLTDAEREAPGSLRRFG